MKPFYIFNSLNRAVEEFQPLNSPEVTLYSCGPTVYLPQHLGNLRAYVFVDSLRRTLEFNGYQVRHVMNVTDVGHMTSNEDAGEDKIEKTARAQGKSPLEVANYYLEQFQRDCAALNLEPPQVWSRATDHVGDMIALVKRIIDAGVAYVTRSGVYFDVEKYRGENRLGRLSRQSLDEQNAAQRLEHSADKHSPHDFTLWVLGQPDHLMQWDSPWGRGYPGWHIECSAMAMKYLGETIDIHTGGIDHIPVHHENEIAQSESATHKPFARYFVHNAFLVGDEGSKISKSSGKFPVLSDLNVEPLAFRIFCYGAKYRSEIAFNDDAIRAAQGNLDYFREFARSVPDDAAAEGVEAAGWAAEYYERFHEAINNDLNMPQALAVALELIAEAYRRKDFRAWRTLLALDAVLGLELRIHRQRVESAGIEPDVQVLIENRTAARNAKDFIVADDVRKEIAQRGYEIKDSRGGSASYKPRNLPINIRRLREAGFLENSLRDLWFSRQRRMVFSHQAARDMSPEWLGYHLREVVPKDEVIFYLASSEYDPQLCSEILAEIRLPNLRPIVRRATFRG